MITSSPLKTRKSGKKKTEVDDFVFIFKFLIALFSSGVCVEARTAENT